MSLPAPENIETCQEFHQANTEKDRSNANYCFDECIFKNFGGIDENGNLVKENISFYMNKVFKENPDQLEVALKGVDTCFEKSELNFCFIYFLISILFYSKPFKGKK